MSLVRSRSIEMLYDRRFSTRTLPSRSSTRPRGARSASVRWWLFSAISSNLACCTTCSTQKLTARIEKTTVIPYCRIVRRVVMRRRSSINAINSPPKARAAPRAAPLHGAGQQLDQLKGDHADHRVADRLPDRGRVRCAEMPHVQYLV